MMTPKILGAPKLVDRFSTEGKLELVKHFQDVFVVVDSLIPCKFTTFALWTEGYAEMLSTVTGWDITPKEIEIIGESTWNAERAFNIPSFGDGRAYDTLPKRLLEEPIPEGLAKGYTVKLAEILNRYYEIRDGRPTRTKLEELTQRLHSPLAPTSFPQL